MHTIITLDNYLSKALPLIEKTLHDLIPSEKVPYQSLFQASRYALEDGKRLRPLLTLAVIEGYDFPLSQGLYPACALELIHCYSLIHDDLPCMDDDDFRRGKPSLHRAFPEGLAILTGDFLLTYAFEVLSNAPKCSDTQKNALIRTLACHAGSKGMIGGQIMDLEAKKKSQDISSFLQMQRQKTSSLMMAALEFGAIVANQNPLPFKSIGEKLGLAFQIYDDIADMDKENNPANIVFLIGKDQAKIYAKKLYDEVMKEISNLGSSMHLLEDLARIFIFRENDI